MAPTPWSLRWGLYVMEWMHPGRWCSPGLCCTRVCPSFAYRQNLLSSLKTTECHCGVSGSLARGTRNLSPAANRRFPMVLGDTAGATCAWISFLDALWAATSARTMHPSWHASVLRGCPELGIQLWECSSDHCWKQRHTIDTLCPTWAAIRRYAHPTSHRPMYNMIPFKWLKLFNRSNLCNSLIYLFGYWKSVP